MQEKRRIKRRYLLYYMRVYDDDSHQQIGNLVDITPVGAMVVSETPIPVKLTYHLKLELSDDISDQPFLEFTARSLWCQADVEPHFYNTGFKIVKLDPDQVGIVERIVEVYGFRDN